MALTRCLAFALGVALCCTPVSSRTTLRPPLTGAQLGAIDRFVVSEMARTHVPGTAIGVYSRGALLLAKGYGLANVELDVPVKAQTIFQSGSVGKQFVSAAIMMLVEQHRVSLDDSIVAYFPGAPPRWRPIKVKNLLSHTSGLAEYETGDRTGPNGPFYLRLDFTENQLLRKIESLPIENPPGAKWNYRNTNYVLLGMLIHRVTGMFYADYLKQRIFEPLGMTSTRLISEADIVPNRSAGYQWENGSLKNQDWVSPTFNSTADGALYFNVLDLAKWDAALYTTRLLSRASLNRIWTVYRLNGGKPNPASYGFAWRVLNQNGHRMLTHSGAWQGFTCNISRFPDDSLTVVALTNLDAGHARPDYMAQVVAGIADPALMPKKLTAIHDAQPRIAASLAALLEAARSRASVRKLFAPDFAQELGASDVRDIRNLAESYWPGTLTLVERVPSPENGSLTLSQFRVTKGSRSKLITYSLDARGRRELLFFEPDKEFATKEI